MKIKQSILTLQTIALLSIVSSCGGNSDQSSTPALEDNRSSTESIFKEFPGKFLQFYEPYAKEVAESNPLAEPEKQMKLYERFYDESRKFKKEESKKADQALLGKTIPCSQEENLDYKVTSDITIKTVYLPYLELTSIPSSMTVYAKCEVAFSHIEKSPYTVYYFLMAGDTPVDYQSFDIYEDNYAEKYQPEDNNAMGITLLAPNIPTKYLNKVNKIHFVSEKTFYEKKYEIKKQKRQWETELKEDLSIL